MASVTIHSDFGAQENKNLSLLPFFSLSTCHEVMGLDDMILVFWMLTFRPAFFCSPFSSSLSTLFSNSTSSQILTQCHFLIKHFLISQITLAYQDLHHMSMGHPYLSIPLLTSCYPSSPIYWPPTSYCSWNTGGNSLICVENEWDHSLFLSFLT